jgi:uncharacterized radical SAM superfamily Fe-S cluster-containing enzyme
MALALSVLGSGPTFTQKLQTIRDALVAKGQAECERFFELGRFDRLLKTTISLCPQCLAHVPAVVYTLDNRVLLSKRCPEHGISQALMESDAAFYYLSNKDQWGRRFADDRVMEFPAYAAGCCGSEGCCDSSESKGDLSGDFTDQMANKTCTVLVEVTNACNLACPVCYSDAKGDRRMPLDVFQRYMTRLVEEKGGLDSVQLTGGEAMLHPEFWRMMEFLRDLAGVKRVYIPTNGILLARREVAEKLLPFKAKTMVLLQFDGRDVAANQPLRQANTIDLRQRVIEHLSDLGICMQLTMTIARGVNERDVGWVVDTALRHKNVKLAALQPVTYSGRYDLPPDPMNRLTLSDVVKAVVHQAKKRMREEEFLPIPCSHPNCGWVTLFARRLGLTVNIARRIDLARAMDRVAYKTILSTDEIRDVVDRGILAALGRKLIRAQDVIGVAIKPFMDRFNYDQDRISGCCHHTLDTHGRMVSFCEYNARLRPGDSWDAFPELTA